MLPAFFTSSKAIKLYIFIGVITVVLLGARFLYNKHIGLVESLSTANTKVEELSQKVENRDAQIKEMNERVKFKDNTIGELIESEREQQSRINMLENKLTKDGRDIGVMVRRKPELMEKIIDRGAKQRMRCLEIASGSPVTEDDINENNTVCPHLITPDSN